MITTVRNSIIGAVCLLGAWGVSVSPVFAQGSLSLSVTPTLFEVSVDPGQVWRSSVRVINPNPHDIEVYAQPVHFSAQGETGVGTFDPVLEQDAGGLTLAEWIDVPEEAIDVPSQQTTEVPFTVQVPSDAPPGGQFAAILISTQPPAGERAGSQVRTTQAVTTLFFMRIAGDIDERGQIRSFRTLERLVQQPTATFALRFENQGNVHLQPQGDITIYNMWGERRGEIPINQRSQFGKVLPDTIRSFTFSWEGEFSLVDIGRYRAEVTLGYGEDERSFVSRTTHFWVIPVYGLLVVLGSVLLIASIVAWWVRAYVRRMLTLSGVRPGRRGMAPEPAPGDVDLSTTSSAAASAPVLSSKPKRIEVVLAPLRSALQEVRARLASATSGKDRLRAMLSAGNDYRLFIFGIVGFIAIVALVLWFAQTVRTADRPFEVLVDDAADGIAISSEEIRYQELRQDPQPSTIAVDADHLSRGTTTPALSIVNVSEVPGAAAELRIVLEEFGYTVATLSTDLNRSEDRSVIVYDQSYQDEALALSKALGGALLSARSVDTLTDVPIVLYLGADVANP